MKRLVALVGGLSIAVCVCACDARQPPRPVASFRPEVVGIVTGVSPGPCGDSQIVLAPGTELDLILADRAGRYRSSCPRVDAATAWLALGTLNADHLSGALFLFGHDDAGKAWYGWVNQPVYGSGTSGYCLEGGAFEEDGTYHLSSGVVLEKARSYASPTGLDTPVVVPENGMICLDERGDVLSVIIPMAS